MEYLKKDFNYHKLFNNKYCNTTYLAFLCGKREITHTKDEALYELKTYIIIIIDFILRINNAICRRGTISNNISDIKKLYKKKFKIFSYTYFGYEGRTLEEWYKDIDSTTTNKYIIEINEMFKKIFEIEPLIDSNYNEFKKEIFLLVKHIDDNHYTWMIGKNIVYNRSLCDNIMKRYYCIATGSKGYDKFKKVYYDMVLLNTKTKNSTFDDICTLLINIADAYNGLINKDITDGKERFIKYIKENQYMLNCKDIYYARIFEKLMSFVYLLEKNKKTDLINYLKEIINNENIKYKKCFIMYEVIGIDRQALENEEFFEL